MQDEIVNTNKPMGNINLNKLKISTSHVETPSKEVQKSSMGARATDSARVMKFTKALSGTTVILGIVLMFLVFYFIFSYSISDLIDYQSVICNSRPCA